MNWKKSTLFWILAFVLMAAVAVYQRMSGPTYPIKGKLTIAGKEISYKLLRSENCGTDARINILAPAPLSGIIELKRYKSHDTLTRTSLERVGDTLMFDIAHQPAAGKVQYQIFINDTSKNIKQAITPEPILIRYKGVVPNYVLIIHIIFMFGAMLFAARTTLSAFAKADDTYKLTLWTVAFLFIGGLILGPIVQKFAFDAYWTGWPFGTDLTDNKTIIALLVWVFSLYKLRNNPKDFKWAIIAFAVMMIVYLIPHSMLGSELDYTKQIN